MDWTAMVELAVGLARIALCGLLVYGAISAVIAAFPTKRNSGKRHAPHRPIRTTGELGHSK